MDQISFLLSYFIQKKLNLQITFIKCLHFTILNYQKFFHLKLHFFKQMFFYNKNNI